MLLARVNDLLAVAVATGLTKINFRIVTVFGILEEIWFRKLFQLAEYHFQHVSFHRKAMCVIFCHICLASRLFLSRHLGKWWISKEEFPCFRKLQNLADWVFHGLLKSCDLQPQSKFDGRDLQLLQDDMLVLCCPSTYWKIEWFGTFFFLVRTGFSANHKE